jgi:hypothetical protein
MTTNDTTATTDRTWEVVSPKGYVDNPVTAPDIETAVAAVEARGLKVVDGDGERIVVADEAESTPAKPARATRSTAAPAAKAEPKFKGQAVEHYAIVKTTPGFDQLSKTDKDVDGPDWITRCNQHCNTAPAGNRKAGRGLGSAAARATWCRGCKAAAAKTAAAK